jgi:hypothetical protein
MMRICSARSAGIERADRGYGQAARRDVIAADRRRAPLAEFVRQPGIEMLNLDRLRLRHIEPLGSAPAGKSQQRIGHARFA